MTTRSNRCCLSGCSYKHGMKYNQNQVTLSYTLLYINIIVRLPKYHNPAKFILHKKTQWLNNSQSHTPRCEIKDPRNINNINNISQYTGQRKRWTSSLSWYSLMAWCTYPRNETLVHQQLFLHELHHPHPSQQLTKQFFLLHDVTRSIYVRKKSLLHVLSTLPR